jgi:phosphohistidine phosphatase
MTTMRTLIVLRHAKAEQTPGVSDRDRKLTARGEVDAERAGKEIRDLGLEPDLVLCSPAQRTRSTAQLALPGVETDYQPLIYQGMVEELLELVRRAEPERRTVVLCGHNPGVLDLALLLAGGDFGFPPGAFAVIRTDAAWADLWPGDGSLVTLWNPKEH